jgi:hypothetical protein
MISAGWVALSGGMRHAIPPYKNRGSASGRMPVFPPSSGPPFFDHMELS